MHTPNPSDFFFNPVQYWTDVYKLQIEVAEMSLAMAAVANPVLARAVIRRIPASHGSEGNTKRPTVRARQTPAAVTAPQPATKPRRTRPKPATKASIKPSAAAAATAPKPGRKPSKPAAAATPKTAKGTAKAAPKPAPKPKAAPATKAKATRAREKPPEAAPSKAASASRPTNKRSGVTLPADLPPAKKG